MYFRKTGWSQILFIKIIFNLWNNVKIDIFTLPLLFNHHLVSDRFIRLCSNFQFYFYKGFLDLNFNL